jgi:hypothetical protein
MGIIETTTTIGLVKRGPPVYEAMTAILDITDSWAAGAIGIVGVEFLLNDILQNTAIFVAGATTEFGGPDFQPQNPFVPGKSMIGLFLGSSWFSDTSLNNRLYYIQAPSGFQAFSFDTVRINNFHNSGASVTAGIRNTKLWITPDIFPNKVFEQAVPNGTLIFDGEIRQHVPANVRDDIDLVLI